MSLWRISRRNCVDYRQTAFGDTLSDMLRDRLVCEINEEKIQRRLLQEVNLTFEDALRIARAMETAAKN